MKVLTVIPAYQAAQSIDGVVKDSVRWLSQDGPVLVVDDGSTDGTGDLARRAGARVLRHPRNRGKGAALRTGFAWAKQWGADCALTLDADGQHSPEEALRIGWYPVPSTTLVLGVRDLVAAGAPNENRFSNGVSNFFLSRFSGQELKDTHCGLRRYPIAATLELGAWSDGFAYEAEVVLRAARSGWRIEQLPVRVWYPPPDQRRSHFHAVWDPIRIVATVLLTVATTRRNR
jgi:glycosyltransferase involved in cell wall biosynthesis